MPSSPRVTLLAGGVGAARLLRGLTRVVDPQRLTIVVNTGDDEEFYGLHVSPDLDTIVYTLAGLAPLHPGWGIKGDSFHARGELDRLYGEGWFALGDRDLATHIFRSEKLRDGFALSEVTASICRSHGVCARVLPMSDDRVRTLVTTTHGRLAFQDYLVKYRARPRVSAVNFSGARGAAPAPGVLEAIATADVVLIAPSNPFVSIGPMLALPALRRAVAGARSRVIGVSPLINGRAVKGPLASMLRSIGAAPGLRGIAEYYKKLARCLVVAPGDTPKRPAAGWPAIVEHDILLTEQPRTENLCRFLLTLATGTDASR